MRTACGRGRGVEGKEVPGPIGLGIIRSSAGIPLDCVLTLSKRWGPPHPRIKQTVMNYITNDIEPDCSLYPYDVMAIQALYQNVP